MQFFRVFDVLKGGAARKAAVPNIRLPKKIAVELGWSGDTAPVIIPAALRNFFRIIFCSYNLADYLSCGLHEAYS